MAIWTKEADIPSEFPPTRLFLDDLEEIVRILRELVESREVGYYSEVEDLEIKIRLSSAGKVCDNFQDLPKIKGSNRKLRISVARGNWVETTLQFHAWFGTTWGAYSFSKGDTWSAFNRLQSVFQKRTRRWSALLRSLPSWLRWLLWIGPMWLIPFLRFPLYKAVPQRAADALTLLAYVIFVIVAIIGFRHTTLVFRNSWDISPFRQYVKDKLIPVIVGAIFGIGGTILTLYLRHKYWP